MTTINKIKEARNKVVLDFNEMLDVKKYMFKELLKQNNVENIDEQMKYIDSLDTLNPKSIDLNKLSPISQNILYIVFGGYISIVSSKRINEEFNFDKILFENEVSFSKYDCNIYKKMYVKYVLNYEKIENKNTLAMLNQLMEELSYFQHNLFVFKLNENRSLLLVNSFFRLFFDSYPEKKSFKNLNIADFTSFPSLNAIMPNETILTENRRYKYDIHELDYESVDYINSL